MRDLSEDNVTAAVIARMAGCTDTRLTGVMESFIRHLHAFVREVEPTQQEWQAGIQFLTLTGQMCDQQRQEFVLLSDILGVSMLVDAINNRRASGGTENTLLGPFHVEGAPAREAGNNIASTPGDPLTVRGRVLAVDGRPIAGASLDVWQTAANGLYDVQDPQQQPYNLRGRFSSDAEGRFEFRTIRPCSYPIPSDGPVGQLLDRLKRHPFRPAHIHFIVSAPGFRTLTTELFEDGDRYLDSDAVFGVKDSLVVKLRDASDGADDTPCHVIEYDFELERV